MRLHKKFVPVVSLCLSVGIATVVSVAPTQYGTKAASAATGISLEFLGRANSGSGNAGSEIAAYDAKSKRLFVTNGATNNIQIFDIANPSRPTLLKNVDLGALGVTGIQSVASKAGYVAASASVGGNNQAAGKVFLMDVDGNIDKRATTGIVVGSLPDSVHFSPNGKFLLSANEGEPRDYCLTDGVLPTTTDPNGSVSVIDVTSTTLETTTIDFSSFNANAADIRAAGGRIYGPGATVAQDIEPEYIAITPDSKKAFVTLQENNSVAEIDLTTKKITKVMGLGYKDFNATGKGLDPSDQDSSSNSGINIANWPVRGMYQPDAIASFSDDAGNHYFATANEGDAREYKCLLGGLSSGSAQAEDVRVSAVGVDGTALASTVATASNLGRLGVTRFEPATYTNGGTALTAASATDFTSLYTLGARSLSIWKSPTGTNSIAGATLVGDTGDAIEKKIAELLPTYFNADWSTSTGTPSAKDSRSDNKGPEPEGLAVAKVFGRTVAFVGLERIGGVMAFDISSPSNPTYLTYTNSSVFTGVGGANFATAGAPAGDVSPESVLFVKASESPTGDPLVIVAHELSGTTAIYKVVGSTTTPARPTNVVASLSKYSAKVSWTEPEDDGGKPLTSYVVKAVPGPDFCTTTTTSCVIKGLQAGVKYRFTVAARNSDTTGSASIASNYVQPKFFASNVGRTISIAKKPATSFATDVAIFVKDRNVSVGVVTPKSKVKGQQVVRYSIELRDQSGKTIDKKLSVTKAGATVLTAVESAQSGRVRVVVVASSTNSKKTVWNGPFITLK
jgi:hypothetical protein